MSDELVVIRFPDGDAEFHVGGETLSVGSRLVRRDTEWIVARVDERSQGRITVIVMPADVARDASWPTPYELATPSIR